MGGNVRIGEGCIIGYKNQIDCDVTIGDFVNIQTMAIVGHDSIIGDWCMIDCQTFMGGFSSLGTAVSLHTGSKILPKVYVGDNAVVDAGSIVVHTVKPNSVVMGNPAREVITPKIK
jgi:UDP-3-O-[3-hydroxymyristoyl] glucosamine N-acyltransferase